MVMADVAAGFGSGFSQPKESSEPWAGSEVGAEIPAPAGEAKRSSVSL